MADLGSVGRVFNRRLSVYLTGASSTLSNIRQTAVDRIFVGLPEGALRVFNNRVTADGDIALNFIYPLQSKVVGPEQVYIGGQPDLFGIRTVNKDSDQLYTGFSLELADGNPGAPALAMRNGGKFRFRWKVVAGQNQISVNVKQEANQNPRPTLRIYANTEVGLLEDIVGTAESSTGWVTIGPLSFTSESYGVMWCALESNYAGEFDGAPCYWDHLDYASTADIYNATYSRSLTNAITFSDMSSHLVASRRSTVDSVTLADTFAYVLADNTLPTGNLIMAIESSDFDALANGTALDNWNDISGNNRNWAWWLGKPTVDGTRTTGGHKTVRFAGAQAFTIDKFFATSGYTGMEQIVIAKRDNDVPSTGAVAAGMITTMRETVNDYMSHHPWTDGNFYEGFGVPLRVNQGNPTTNLASAFFCYDVAVAGTNDLYDAWINSENFCHLTGGYVFGSLGNEGTARPYYAIGNAWTPSPGYYFVGNIAAIYIYSKRLSTEERAQIRRYITAKWGITF